MRLDLHWLTCGQEADSRDKHVVFSIFKKNKPDQTKLSQETAGAITPAQSVTQGPSTLSQGFAQADLGIEVCSGSDMLTPAEEQAAMSYANGQDVDAKSVLQAEIAAIKGQRRLDTWLMLFELYQQTDQRTAFDELGLEFVAEFEKTPPIWRALRASAAVATPAGANTVVFGSKLTDATIKRELDNYQKHYGKSGTLRLDFSRVTEIDTFAAIELLSCWQRSRKPGLAPQLSGWHHFAKLLQGKIAAGRAAPAEAPFWMLLTEVYQALGQQEEFENLAIDYAVTYEVSPPSWDARFAPKVAIREAEKTLENTPAASASEGLQISASLTAQNGPVLDEIRDYIKTGASHLILDFSRVDRLDFESAGQLLNIAMVVLQEGKSVLIRQCNALVLAMLRLMGIADMVQVERRKV
jgi:anti-anti-sigma regulatory factor